ncbi:MAG: phosphotransferase [Ilumatobacteraceae bacterium]
MTPLRRVPGSPRALVHRAAGRRALRTRSLAGAADWRRAVADRLAFASVAIAGPAALPASNGWDWPRVGTDELAHALRRDLPGLTLVGAVLPRQPGRHRLSLLCHAAGNPLVVKLGDDEQAFLAEHRALELLVADPLPGIATPRTLGSGRLATTELADPITWHATSALGLGAQRPAIDEPLHTFESDLGSRLAGLPRPPSTPDDAVPVHGDLTPWNLRRTSRGLALFDWESAGWGPPGSDLATYRAASAEVRPWWREGPP